MQKEELRTKAKKRAIQMKEQGLQPWLADYENPADIPSYDLEQYRKILYTELEKLYEY